MRTFLLVLALAAVLCSGWLLFRRGHDRQAGRPSVPVTHPNSSPPGGPGKKGLAFARAAAGAAPSQNAAEEIVSRKLRQFGQSRRELALRLAARRKIEAPSEVSRFFDAVEKGDWQEISDSFEELNRARKGEGKAGSASAQDVLSLWGPILETFGVAEAAHSWPAAQLLAYGNSVLDSLRSGMVYVGGTDSGRFIPTLLNETSDSERHVLLTQNGLADATYADYVRFQYSDRFQMFTGEESQRAFQEYLEDAQKRLAHDEKFPNEPKQLLPGEVVNVQDGKVQVSGQAAVMSINEKLLHIILKKNPDLGFGLEESIPLKSTYPDAVPLGPIMELRASDDAGAFSSESASSLVEYWRNTSARLLADPDAAHSEEVLKTYGHMADSQANLLLAHDAVDAAEQTYRLAAGLWPGDPEAANGLSAVLARSGRAEEGRKLLEDFNRKYPDLRKFIEDGDSWRLLFGGKEGPPKP